MIGGAFLSAYFCMQPFAEQIHFLTILMPAVAGLCDRALLCTEVSIKICLRFFDQLCFTTDLCELPFFSPTAALNSIIPCFFKSPGPPICPRGWVFFPLVWVVFFLFFFFLPFLLLIFYFFFFTTAPLCNCTAGLCSQYRCLRIFPSFLWMVMLPSRFSASFLA